MPIGRTPDVPRQGEAQPIYIELDEDVDTVTAVDPASLYGEQATRALNTDHVLTMARDVFDEGVELARSCAIRVANGLAELPSGVRAPDEFEIQLAIKLDAQVGAVLAKASTGAQLQVKVRWTNE